MAKPPNRKLKVFVAQIGFYDTVVAAASQAAALRAWGTHQNLFAGGQARVINDPQAVQAALECPDVPLRRIIGTDNPFELNPRGLPKVPDAAKNWADGADVKRPAIPNPAPTKPRKRADRGALDKAEAALRKVDDERKLEEARLRERQEQLDAERMNTQSSYIERRKAATAAVVTARQAYRKAGGTD